MDSDDSLQTGRLRRSKRRYIFSSDKETRQDKGVEAQQLDVGPVQVEQREPKQGARITTPPQASTSTIPSDTAGKPSSRPTAQCAPQEGVLVGEDEVIITLLHEDTSPWESDESVTSTPEYRRSKFSQDSSR